MRAIGIPFLAMITLFCTSMAKADVVILAFNEWCPYACTKNETRPGILLDATREIFEEANIEVQFQIRPFARAIQEVRANRLQGMIGIIRDAAPDFIFPEEPAIKTQFCFFTALTSRWYYDPTVSSYPKFNLGYLNGKKIATVDMPRVFPRGLAISGEDERVVERVSNMLDLGRLDAFADERLYVGYSLAQSGLPPLRNAGCVPAQNEYVAFSPANKDSERYARIFSDGMKKLKASGRMRAIISTYVADPFR